VRSSGPPAAQGHDLKHDRTCTVLLRENQGVAIDERVAQMDRRVVDAEREGVVGAVRVEVVAGVGDVLPEVQVEVRAEREADG